MDSPEVQPNPTEDDTVTNASNNEKLENVDGSESSQKSTGDDKKEMPSEGSPRPQSGSERAVTAQSGSDQAATARSRSQQSMDRSQSSSSGESRSKRKQKSAAPPDAHKVTFTVTIAQAIPTVEDEEELDVKDASKKKKRVVEAPRAQNYFHSMYQLLPGEDCEPVKTDLVTFGVAAKIYTEKQEPKVLKTWRDGDLTWVAWTHNHTVYLTDDMLLDLYKHNLQLRIWDTKDKVSTRARFDRPKAFRLPQPKPGEDPENVGGVKGLVLKQSKSFEKLQPKKSYINRPLPSHRSVLRGEDKMASPEKVQPGSLKKSKTMDIEMPDKLTVHMQKVGHNLGESTGMEIQPPEPTAQPQHSQPLRSYNRLLQLAGATTGGQSQGDNGQEAARAKTTPATRQAQKDRQAAHMAVPGTAETQSTGFNPFASPRKKEKVNSRRNKRAEAAAAAAAEHAKKYGVCCIPVSMDKLFAGMQTITERLENPVPGIEDLFFTVSLSGPLMSEEQRRKFNPMVIKVHSATQMPSTPMSYNELKAKCKPAYVKYKFYNQPEHISGAREHDSVVYWDDISVVLAGILDPLELRQYLNGPLLEVEVHDRDRVAEKIKLKPTLFGNDFEDEKISNVGVVGGKRTNYNAFKSRDSPWDPYGVAKFNLSELLLGQQVLHMQAPIHPCTYPDILGVRDGKQDRLIGIAGAVDGPVDPPLPMGHYMESHAILKIKVELAYPLVTPDEVAAKVSLPAADECVYGRMVFRFDYKNIDFLQKLQSLVTQINAEALDLAHLPSHIIEAALSTYKLSLEQQGSKTLNIVTGFQMMDGTIHMFVLEGLRDQAIQILWQLLPKPENTDVDVLHNSDLCFKERLYGPLDVDLCRVKLHEPLSIIVKQPLLYVRDMVPKPCFEALTKLEELTKMNKLRDAVRNDLFPDAEMVVSMSREFGVPLTTEDFEELQGQTVEFKSPEIEQVEVAQTSRVWTPIDNLNENYMAQLQEREGKSPPTHFIKENMNLVRERSELNRTEKVRTMPLTLRARVPAAHNYSSQSLNSTEIAKELLRQHLAKDPATRFTYCQDYQHSMTVVPVNVEAESKQAVMDSHARWKTPVGWTYPGKKTMQESNINPRKPDQSRIEELVQPWEENTLHGNKLKETLNRERFTWSKRRDDMDLWRKPSSLFGGEPITIHLAGQKLKEEKCQSNTQDYIDWKSKILVDDTQMKFHRCATDTELTDGGFMSSNQLARLENLLKDKPEKYSLRKPGFALKDIPPLNVVLNPSVDTSARLAGIQIPASSLDSLTSRKGFFPGPFKEHSWSVDHNKIPARDYEHGKFIEAKGQDFNVYHKNRNVLHKRHLLPLTDDERENHLFCLPPDIAKGIEDGTIPKPYIIPDIGDWKQLTRGSYDSGIGTFIKSEKESVVTN